MRSDAGAEGSSRRGRDGLGLFKSIVEFFTSVTGLAAAGVGLLGAVAAIAIADVKLDPQGSPGDPPPSAVDVRPTPATTSPAVAPAEESGVDRSAWVRDVNQACAEVAAVGLSGFAEGGDPSAAAAAFETLAAGLRASPVPSGFEDAVASAADDLDQAAAAAAAGDPSVIDHANAAAATLNSVGATDC